MIKFKYDMLEHNGQKYIKFDSEFDRIRYYYGNWLLFCCLLCLVIFCAFTFFYIYNNVELLKSSPCMICENLGNYCMPNIKI